MIEQIQMLRLAGRISRRDLANTQAVFDEKYAAADADTKAKVDGLLQSSQNYSSANPMNNRSAREFSHHMLQNAIEIMDGSYAEAPGVVASSPNLFNGYSHTENMNNANSVTRRYLNQNQQGSGTSSSSTSSTGSVAGSTSSTGGYFKYNPLKGIDSRWTTSDQTRESLSEALMKTLRANISSAINSGRVIRGGNKDELEDALARIDAGGWRNSFQEVMNIAQLAGLDPDSFIAYYGDKYPGKSKLEINKKARQDEGYEFVEGGDYGQELNEKIAQNGWIVGKKNGQLYFLNQDYSGPVTGQGTTKINTDYRDNTNYGNGYAISSDGAFVFGNMNQYLDDQNSSWYNQLTQHVQGLGNDKRFGISLATFGRVDEFQDPDREALIDTFGNELEGKYLGDVSGYFNGAEVLVTSKNNNLDRIKDRYGNLRLDDPNLTFYYKNGDHYEKGNLQQAIKAVGDITFNYDKARGGFEQFTDLTSGLSGLEMDSEFKSLDLNGRSGFRNDARRSLAPIGVLSAIADTIFGTNIEANITSAGVKNEWDNKTLNEQKDIIGSVNGLKDSARFFLYLSKNPNADPQIYRSMIEDPQNRRNVQALIEEAYRTLGPNQLFAGSHAADYRRAYKDMLRTANTAYTTPIPTNVTAEHKKQGGILKAETGQILDRYGNPAGSAANSPAARARENLNRQTMRENAQIDRAQEKGNSVLKQATIEDNKWTASDTLRMTALATDVAGLVAAMASPATAGLGSVAAVGSGVASMVQDAVADFTDDKVSAGEAWRNIGINTGLAAAAAVGGKAPKIISRVVKYLPKILMVAGTAGLAFSPEVQESVGKAVSGKRLTVNDWKNISYVLRTATGFGTLGTMKYKQSKGLEIYKGKVNENLKKLAINSDLDPNLKYIANEDGTLVAGLSNEKYKDLSAALKKKDGGAEALQIIKEANPELDDEAAKAFIKTVKGKTSWKDKAKFWKDTEAPEDTFALNDVDVNTAKGIATGPDVYAQARMRAIADIRNEARTSHTSARLNQWEANPFVESFNPALGAAMNEAQAAGWAGKNINELLQYDNERLNPFGPNSNKLSMTDTEFSQLKRNQLKDIHTDADVQDARANLGKLRRKAKQSAASAEVARQDLETANSQLEEARVRSDAASLNLRNAVYPNRAKAQRIREIRAEIQAIQDGQSPQPKAGQQLSIDFGDPAQRQQRIANLTNKANNLMLEIKGSLKDIHQANVDLAAIRQEVAARENNAQFRQRRLDLINKVKAERDNRVGVAENDFRAKYTDASLRSLNNSGKLIGVSQKDASVRVNGKDVTVKTGTAAFSYQHIRNTKEAEAVAKYGSKNMASLSKEDISKLLPSNIGKVRGAAVDTKTGDIVVWKQGGKMNEKYSHLRK